MDKSDKKITIRGLERLFNHFIIGISLVLLPLLVAYQQGPLSMDEMVYTTTAATFINGDAALYFDYFTLIKARFLWGIGIVSWLYIIILVSTQIKAIKHRPLNPKILYFSSLTILVLAGSILVSLLFSPFKALGFYGFSGHFEGAFSLLSYMGLCLVAMRSVYLEAFRVPMVLGLGSAVLVAILGIGQTLGLDPIRLFLLQNNIKLQVETSTYNATQAYGTFFNANPYGLYMAMWFIVSLVLLFDGKWKLPVRFMYFLSTLVLFLGLLTSFSRGAYLAVAITTLILIIKFAKAKINMLALVLIGVILTTATAFNALQKGEVMNKALGLFNQSQHAENLAIDKIKGFDIEGALLMLHASDTSLWIEFDVQADASGNNRVIMTTYDGHHKPLKLIDDTGGSSEFAEALPTPEGALTFQVDHESYVHWKIVQYGPYIRIQKGKSALYFVYDDKNRQIGFLDLHGNRVETLEDQVPRLSILDKYQRLGSGRGYIWSRALPILAQAPVFGYGPDTFTLMFPQADYKGKLSALYDAYIVIDKAHNMYIQYGIQTGLPSLACLVILIFIGGFWPLFLKKGDLTYFYMAISGAVISGALGFFFTDSHVGLAPLYWIFIGLGVGHVIRGKDQDPIASLI